MTNETAGPIDQSFLKASRLLPAGATLSAVAGLFESFAPDGGAFELTTAVAAAIAAGIAWVLVLRDRGTLSENLGIRFFSILGMALAFSVWSAEDIDLVRMAGVMGLWVAAGGAAIEWRRGRTYPNRD